MVKMDKLFKQAQKMQTQMVQIQERLAEEKVEGAAGGGMVRVVRERPGRYPFRHDLARSYRSSGSGDAGGSCSCRSERGIASQQRAGQSADGPTRWRYGAQRTGLF